MQDRVVVVLGATGGIGSALCRRLAVAGARLVVAARTCQRVREFAATLDALPVPIDATRADAVDRLFAETLARHGRVDAVAHCVGAMLLKPAHLTTDDEWTQVVAQNLGSAFYALRAAVRAMTPTGGAIALVSSAAARLGLANHEAVAAAKAGVEGLVRSAAATYARRGIRVNAVAPGLVRTAASAHLVENPAALAASTALHPLGRLGEPDEIAAALAWLLDPAQSWVTGQVLGVDGGLATARSR
jgi:NAD(P)-dependent dehydrogenase (short-subunit alcohol dehydrogenase family)